MASWRMASVYRTLHRWKYTSASSNPIPIPRTRASTAASTFQVTFTLPIYASRAVVSYIATTRNGVTVTEQTLAASAGRPSAWWSVVRDAVRGAPHDYTAGSLGRGIVLLAIPMVLEMGMESIFAVVDVFWVSRLGPDAVATVGLTESIMTLVYTAAMGLSIGVAAVVARRPALMGNLVRLSGSGTFQVLVGTASYVGLVRIMSTFGSAALAGYTISIRILVFALLPSWGLSNAAATMVGQSLGAGKPERAERAAWLAAGYNMAVLGAVGLLFIAFAGPIVGVFTRDPVALPTGALALRTMSFGFVFYALGFVLTQAFNGAGDTWTPTWINLACFWLWEIPLAYLLALVWGFGPQGVFVAITVGYSTLALVSVVLFKRGRWKLRRV